MLRKSRASACAALASLGELPLVRPPNSIHLPRFMQSACPNLAGSLSSSPLQHATPSSQAAAVGIVPDLKREASASVTKLHTAAMAGRAFEVQALLERRVVDLFAATTPTGLTALDVASMYGHPSVVAALLHRGADPFRRIGYVPAPTACHLAVRNGQADVVRCFIANGLDPNTLSTKYKYPPLLHAALEASKRRVDILSMLLEAGADPSIATSDGVTAVQRAVSLESGAEGDEDRKQLREAIRVLIRHGADPAAAAHAGIHAGNLR